MSEVDLSLVLALDGSASVTYDEFGLIVGGLAQAFRNPQIIAGLTGGAAGATQCAVLLWSGRDAQDVLIDWTRIASPADARDFADAIDNIPRAVPAGLTAIGAALLVALDLLGHAPAPAERQVVDVAGDGRSNDGPAPGPVRDRIAAMGITINGLCVLHEEADLLENYQREVIGGPGSFALSCPDYAAFAEAMRQKLQRELVS
jgi:Ca-activated chloride channel family protein